MSPYILVLNIFLGKKYLNFEYGSKLFSVCVPETYVSFATAGVAFLVWCATGKR